MFGVFFYLFYGKSATFILDSLKSLFPSKFPSMLIEIILWVMALAAVKWWQNIHAYNPSSPLVMGRNMAIFVFPNVAVNSLVAWVAVCITTVIERPMYQTTHCN